MTKEKKTNTGLVVDSVNQIERLNAALSWLTKYGLPMKAEDRGSTFRFDFKLFVGSLTAGASEASELLGICAGRKFEEIRSAAIEDCKNSIEMHKSIIRNEMDK